MKKIFMILAAAVFALSILVACDAGIYDGAIETKTPDSYATCADVLSNTAEEKGNELNLEELIANGLQIIEGIGSAFVEIHNSIDYLISDATEVIRAEILDERVVEVARYESPSAILYAFRRLRVLEVFYGNAEIGDIIEIRQLLGNIGEMVHSDGQVENVLFLFPHRTEFEIGEEAVLFIQSYKYGDINLSELANPIQAAYRLPPGYGLDIRAMFADIVLESINPDNRLTLTVGDLLRVSDGEYSTY